MIWKILELETIQLVCHTVHILLDLFNFISSWVKFPEILQVRSTCILVLMFFDVTEVEATTFASSFHNLRLKPLLSLIHDLEDIRIGN